MESSTDQFLDHLTVEKNLAAKTVEAYAHDLGGFRAAMLAEDIRCPKAIGPVHVSRWLRSLSERKLASSSQRRALSAVATPLRGAPLDAEQTPGCVRREPALRIQALLEHQDLADARVHLRRHLGAGGVA